MPAWESSRLTENWLFVPANTWDGAAGSPAPAYRSARWKPLCVAGSNTPFPLSVTFHFLDSLSPSSPHFPPFSSALKCLSPVHRSQLSSVHWTFPYCRSYCPLRSAIMTFPASGFADFYKSSTLFSPLFWAERESLNYNMGLCALNKMLFLCISTSCIPWHPWLPT